MQKKCIFLRKYLVNSKFYCNFARFFYGRSMFFNMNKLEKAHQRFFEEEEHKSPVD